MNPIYPQYYYFHNMFLIGFYPALLTYVPLRKIVVFKSSGSSYSLKKSII